MLLTMDLDFGEGTAAADAATAISDVERQVRERYPMIRRLFIEAGATPSDQRWSRPDSTQRPPSHPSASSCRDCASTLLRPVLHTRLRPLQGRGLCTGSLANEIGAVTSHGKHLLPPPWQARLLRR